MRVLFCGDREWTDEKLIVERLYKYPTKICTIIHGAARGADSIAGRLATEFGFKVEVYPALWEKYGKSAGAIRNRQMLNSGIDIVEAFHNDLEKSKGTKDMISIAADAGKTIYLNGESAVQY